MPNSGFHKSAPPINIPKQNKPNLEFQHLQENSKSSKVLVVLLIIVFAIALIISSYYIYNFFFKDKPQATLSENIDKQDSDGDGLTTVEELEINTDPAKYDTDLDKIPDGWEVKNRLDPKNYLDATEDFDKDNLNNFQEFQYNSDPNLKDTDNDGFKDFEEVKNGFNPNGKGKLIK